MRAFGNCRRDLEVYELPLAPLRERVAHVIADEARRKHERAQAALTCKLTGPEPGAVAGYGTELVNQPRPPACVGDALPLALAGGVHLENCRYGVARYRDDPTEWARQIAHDARMEGEAQLETAIERFNCKLLAERWRGVPCFSGKPPATGRYAHR